jgi:hypothetical protein
MSNSPEMPSRAVREAMSWKLVAELHRRHPGESTVIETHPGGGQYDCLTFVKGDDVIACLNRVGGFTVHPTGVQVPSEAIWPVSIVDGGVSCVLDRLSVACRFPVPAKLPPTSPETLAYRVMAGVAAALVFEKDLWEWRNGQEDTSGMGDQACRDHWFELFPGATESARSGSPDQPFGNPKYGFWFLLRNGKPAVCISKAALCWDTDLKVVDLASAYRRDRRIHRLVGAVLERLK